MTDGIKITELVGSLTPALDYVFPAVSPEGVTEKLSVEQVANLVMALIVDGSPGALDTLNELASALGNDADFASTVNAALAARLKLDGSTAMSGSLDLGSHDLLNAGNLVGQVAWFSMSSPPNGWLKANGAALSRTTYSRLFSKISTTFGAGDGSTTFNLPDLRGEFVRGWDDARGVDVGRSLGSTQTDELKSHSHILTFPRLLYIGDVGTGGNIISTSPGASWASNVAFPSSTGTQGGAETRPRNVSLLACIRY